MTGCWSIRLVRIDRLGDGGFLALPVRLALDDEFVGGRLQSVHRELGEQQVGHHGQDLWGFAVAGDDGGGGAVAFDRSRIHPYAFRHSYAQRHADNGTPVDVLRQLMDHKSIQTTGGYYNYRELHQMGALPQFAWRVGYGNDGTTLRRHAA
jgi:hypothetical protein